MRSCCKQVRDFVDFGKHLHASARKLYQSLNDEAELERVRMLLDFLARHEQQMEQTFARYEKESHAAILNGWLEYSPELDVDAVIKNCPLPDHPGTDEIVRLALALDDTLVNLYREIAEKGRDHQTRALFQDLLKLEQQERNQVTRAALSLADL